MKQIHSMPSPNKSHLITFLALLTAASAIVSYIEVLIPLPIPLPGIKLGLSNVILLYAIFHIQFKHITLIIIVKSSILLLITSNLLGFFISITGGLFALTMMYLIVRIFKIKISLITLSILGATAHNLGQIVMVSWINKNILLFLTYYPLLTFSAIITGGVIGILYSKLAPTLYKLTPILYKRL